MKRGLRDRLEWRVLALVASLLFATSYAAIAQKQESRGESKADAAAPASPASEGAGEKIFDTKCILCHNNQPGETSASAPPNLFVAFRTNKLTTPQAIEIMTHGKGQMPAFGNILSKSDMTNVIAYIKSVK